MTKKIQVVQGLLAIVLLTVLSGCGNKNTETSQTESKVISNTGSDTMVNVAQVWAEEYSKKSDSKIQVLGGGSGVGLASLIDGTCDMANASRPIKAKEIEQAKAKRGHEPKEFTVGFDALAVYVHKDNPLSEISLEELAEIYGDGGAVDNWAGVSDKTASLGKIVRISRQNSSGTYTSFREAVLGNNRDYKQGSIDQSGSKDVVSLVGHTPGAIGYSGMGYATAEVKMLKISKSKGGEAVVPSVENAQNGTYPITRSLHIYTIGEPRENVKNYLDWILSAEGQKVVADLGYVPVK